MSLMSLVSHDTKKSIEYPHFQIYYKMWMHSLKKPADLLVLFYHYLLIHNRFKCVEDDDKESDYLPTLWNSSKNYYDVMYRKRGINYKLEIHLSDDDIFINLKRLSDSMDTLQRFQVADYVDVDNYQNPDYHISFKNLDQFYQKIQWSISAIKQKSSSILGSTTSNCRSISSLSSLTSIDNLAELTNQAESRISNLILTQIKQEKASLDEELEVYRKKCIITLQKEREKKEAERLRQLKIKAAKMQNSKPIKLYDYNPIINYYCYNCGVKPDLNLDENNCLNDEFYKEAFKKYNLKPARLCLIDCLKNGLLKDAKIPLILTKDMKESLNLNTKSRNHSKVNTTVNKQKRKRSEPITPVACKKPKIKTKLSALQRQESVSKRCIEFTINDTEIAGIDCHERSNSQERLMENIDKYLEHKNTTVDLTCEEKSFLNKQSDNVNKSSIEKVVKANNDDNTSKSGSSGGSWLEAFINKKTTPINMSTQIATSSQEENKENNSEKEINDESFTSCATTTSQMNMIYEDVMKKPTDKVNDRMSQIIPKVKTMQDTLIFGGGSETSYIFGTLKSQSVMSSPRVKNNSAKKISNKKNLCLP